MLPSFNITRGQAQFCPSILSADFAKLGTVIQQLDGVAHWIHVDIMDGHFVPNLTFGVPIVKAIRAYSQLPFDCHLMITDPMDYIEGLSAAGADGMTVHLEACPHLHRVVQAIKSAGMSAGVALNPATPVSLLTDILPDLDLVLLMSVNPGFGGQKFIPQVMRKIKNLRSMIDREGLNVHIEVDGGIGLANIDAVYRAGADAMVAGSAVFGALDPTEVLREFAALCPLKSFAVDCQAASGK